MAGSGPCFTHWCAGDCCNDNDRSYGWERSMKKLDGKRVVITGAASGLGRAMALVLARKGCRIGIADIDMEGAEETLRMVEQAGGSGEVYELDVSQPAKVEAIAGHFLRELGRRGPAGEQRRGGCDRIRGRHPPGGLGVAIRDKFLGYALRLPLLHPSHERSRAEATSSTWPPRGGSSSYPGWHPTIPARPASYLSA